MQVKGREIKWDLVARAARLRVVALLRAADPAVHLLINHPKNLLAQLKAGKFFL